MQNIEADLGGREVPIIDPEADIAVGEEINSKQDSDFEGATDIQIGKRAHQFAKRHLKKLKSL